MFFIILSSSQRRNGIMAASVRKLTRNGWSSLAINRNAASFTGNSGSLMSWQFVLYDLVPGSGYVLTLTAATYFLMAGRRPMPRSQTGTFSTQQWLQNFNGMTVVHVSVWKSSLLAGLSCVNSQYKLDKNLSTDQQEEMHTVYFEPHVNSRTFHDQTDFPVLLRAWKF